MLENIKNKVSLNIAFVGFMGVGKTAVGKILAMESNREFVDIDEEIERKEKMPVKNIFEKYGERRFRELESKTLKEILKRKNLVISCGGGIVLNEKNRKYLKSSLVILLEAEPETILARLKNDTERPLLKNLSGQEKIIRIKTILNERKLFYQDCADYSISTDEYSPEEVVGRIEELVNNI